MDDDVNDATAWLPSAHQLFRWAGRLDDFHDEPVNLLPAMCAGFITDGDVSAVAGVRSTTIPHSSYDGA